MNTLTLSPIHKIEGTINLPGSKSLSNRALLLAALSEGTTTITNLLESDDTRHMLNALKILGIKYTLSKDKTECVLVGNAGAFVNNQNIELFLGNAGHCLLFISQENSSHPPRLKKALLSFFPNQSPKTSFLPSVLSPTAK